MDDETDVIRLVVELDGLLERFGRVFPDAVAMLAVVRHLQQRVKTMPRPPRLVVQVVRFGASLSDPGELATLRSALSQLEPWSAVGSLAAGAFVATDPGDFSPAASEPARVILLTASHHWFQQAIAAGVEAYHIGLDTSPERRGLPFDEVPRILEEALRIPTARPMARSARTGGLVSIRIAGKADAQARALAALLEDPDADWVTIGSDLILYTEQPDLEDRLSEEPGVEHLSYAVHKDALIVEPIATATSATAAGAATGERALYEGYGFVLREATHTEVGWAAIRHRTFQEEDPLAPGGPPRPPPAILPVDRYAAALQRNGSLLAAGLGGRGGPPGERLLAVVREIVGPSSTADLLLSPAAVIWTTPYGGADRDDLVALIHDPALPGDGEGEEALAGEAAAALALAASLSSASSSAGILHCLRLAPETATSTKPIDDLLAGSLQAEERHRLGAVVHLEGLRGLPRRATGEPCVLEITADPRLDRRLEHLRAAAVDVVWTTRGTAGPPRVHVRVRARRNGGPPTEALERILALVASIACQSPGYQE